MFLSRLRLGLVLFSLLALGAAPRAGAAALDAAQLAALRAADDERIAATTAGNRARLEAIYSDALHYGHANGKADTKASQIEAILGGATVYEKFEYKDRVFTPIAPGAALMTGRVIVHVRTQAGARNTLDLSYLAVWRQENGRWRFQAWQSCRNP